MSVPVGRDVPLNPFMDWHFEDGRNPGLRAMEVIPTGVLLVNDETESTDQEDAGS